MLYIVLTTFALCLIMTRLVIKLSYNISLVDIPNHRSSHRTPTPRGGGIAFTLIFLIFVAVIEITGLQILNFSHEPSSFLTALLISGSIIAFIGFLDDKDSLSVKFRFIGQLSAAIIGLYLLGGLPTLTILRYDIASPVALAILGMLYVVWLTNLYNFMDGIDGLAGFEAISVCASAIFLYYVIGFGDFTLLPIILTCLVAGFVVWNFPPAKIFMGDVGSGFLGVSIALISIQAGYLDQRLFWCWMILLGVFIVDASLTLLVRLFTGQNVAHAHCTHAYQHAAKLHNSHLKVTLAIIMINIFWLLPVAYYVATEVLNFQLGMFIAYLPILLLAIKYRAGKPEMKKNHKNK